MIFILVTLGLYTKVDASPLALALWGRAQVLLSMKEYSLALSDMQLALKENLPNAYKGESFWKMAVCYKALNEENRASVAFDLAEKLLGGKMNKEELERDRTASYVESKKESRRSKSENFSPF